MSEPKAPKLPAVPKPQPNIFMRFVDKVAHMGVNAVGILILATALLYLRPPVGGVVLPLGIASAVMVLISLGKEWWDAHHEGGSGWSWPDVGADLLGILIATGALWAWSYLIQKVVCHG